MSRIAKAPIPVPDGVVVTVRREGVSAKGPKGEMSMDLYPGIELVQDEGALHVSVAETAETATRKMRAMSGTMRALVHNLLTGVSNGFEKKLSVVGVGYRAQAQGTKLNLSLGFSHPVVYTMPEGVSVQTPTQTEIVLNGINKQVVGQTAAEIRAFRPPEPYKGKGIRYADEHVIRKQAKKK